VQAAGVAADTSVAPAFAVRTADLAEPAVAASLASVVHTAAVPVAGIAEHSALAAAGMAGCIAVSAVDIADNIAADTAAVIVAEHPAFWLLLSELHRIYKTDSCYLILFRIVRKT